MERSLQAGGGPWVLTGVALLAVVLLVGVAVGGTPLSDRPDGEELLERVDERYDRAETVAGNATVTVTDGTNETNATVAFAFGTDNRSRIVVDHDGASSRAGYNGSVIWVLAPSENVSGAWDVGDGNGSLLRNADDRNRSTALGVTGPGVGNGSDRPVPDLNASNVSATLVETTRLDGTEAYVVEVANPEVDGDARLWVATDDYRVLRARYDDGGNATTVDFHGVRFNASIHPSTFDPPTDRVSVTTTERFDSEAATLGNASLAVGTPGEGWTFRRGAVSHRPAGETVVMRYVDGGHNLTVVASELDTPGERPDGRPVTVAGTNATLTEVRDRTLVYWQAGGVGYAVATDAGNETALAAGRAVADG